MGLTTSRFVATLAPGLAGTLLADAQEAKRVFRVGVLWAY